MMIEPTWLPAANVKLISSEYPLRKTVVVERLANKRENERIAAIICKS